MEIDYETVGEVIYNYICQSVSHPRKSIAFHVAKAATLEIASRDPSFEAVLRTLNGVMLDVCVDAYRSHAGSLP